MHFDLPPQTVRRIREVGAAHGCTVFGATLAAFALWLMRASDQRDVVVGVPSAGRPLVEVHDTVGDFVNLLPLRIVTTPDTAVAELLRSVQARVAEALDHDVVPFDRIVKSVRPPRRRGVAPLTQVTFGLIDDSGLPTDTSEWPGLDVSEVRLDGDDAARFDVELNLVDRGGDRIEGSMTYACDHYQESTTSRWTRDYCRMVDVLTGARRGSDDR